MLAKIVFLGPESTGKSTISQEVANSCNATWVNEFARIYLNEHGADYTYADVLNIAQIQAERELHAELSGNIVVCDTDLITIKIWLAYYGWIVPDWMTQFIAKHKADKYLLMYPDIPWVADDQRKNSHDRIVLFDVFEQELKHMNANYIVIKGTGKVRLEKCMREVQSAIQRCF
jgi:NadR type nicotinamide-nucleotide adenylyltransferase